MKSTKKTKKRQFLEEEPYHPDLPPNYSQPAGAWPMGIERDGISKTGFALGFEKSSEVRLRKEHKNPNGGLSAKGRSAYNKATGSHLKPGVKGEANTPEKQRRKGSWAVRFYGRKGPLPPLKKPNGEPTRLALTAAAWGEPVPQTEAAARRIAAKGRALLAQYRKSKE